MSTNTESSESKPSGKGLGAASCSALKLLHFAWVIPLNILAGILAYMICFIGLLAGRPERSREIAHELGIPWFEII